MGGLKEVCCLLLVSTLFFTFCLPSAMAGKVLVFPVDGSHWINMKIIIEELHARGHKVTVVRTATSWYVKEESPHYKSITVTLPKGVIIEDEDFFVSFLSKMLEIQRGRGSPLAFIKFFWEMLSALGNIHWEASQLAVEIFENQTLMEELRSTHFDLALIDPGTPPGVLVAHKLGLPMVFNVRWITSGEGHFVVAPSPISYVPTSGFAASNQMTFGERVKNAGYYILNNCIDRFIVSPPIMAQTSDLQKPLPAELQQFVEGSGEHGVIIMSLGTLLKGLPAEITSEIAAAFAQLPQRVVWKHVGERPKNLGNNTLLVNWMPQNDLLGHPKTRLFCRTWWHQWRLRVYLPWQLLRLEVRGAAKAFDVSNLKSQDFLKAIKEVLHQPSYRENMQRLSRLHRDQPVHPLNNSIFWIEFVMRHKGAAHLRTESYKMPWYSYHSLDVIGFLLAVMLALFGAVILIMRLLCLRMCRRQKSKIE
uniref:Uncharacterized protein n=1 Tax=Astyanax mexicanus TaxID=7994 RepID=A0A3B1JLH7_ASTMX